VGEDITGKVSDGSVRVSEAKPPRVFVDADPARPGIQSKLNVVHGSSFMIDVVVTGVNPIEPLDAYEFDLYFDPNILRAVSVVSGGFLSGIIIIEQDVTPPHVNWAAGVISKAGVFGDGILATITFEAIGRGGSKLDLREVVLASRGDDITGKIKHGAVTVSPPRRR
jgi:hypothetical protein